MNIQSSPSFPKELLNSKFQEFFSKVQQHLKPSASFTKTPKKLKKSTPKKPLPPKHPVLTSNRTPKKTSCFESTSLNQDSLRQLSSFSSNSEELIQQLKKKLKGSELLITKYQSELLKAYERIGELEAQLKKNGKLNSYESTQQIYKSK